MSDRNKTNYSEAWDQLKNVPTKSSVPVVNSAGTRVTLGDRFSYLILSGLFTLGAMSLVLLFLIPQSLPTHYYYAGSPTQIASLAAMAISTTLLMGMFYTFPKALRPRVPGAFNLGKALILLIFMSVWLCLVQSGLTSYLANSFVAEKGNSNFSVILVNAANFSIDFTTRGMAFFLVLLAGVLGTALTRWYEIHRVPWVVRKKHHWSLALIYGFCMMSMFVSPFCPLGVIQHLHHLKPSIRSQFESRLELVTKTREFKEKSQSAEDYKGTYLSLVRDFFATQDEQQKHKIAERFVTESQVKKDTTLDQWTALEMVDRVLEQRAKARNYEREFTTLAVLSNLRRWNSLQKKLAPEVIWMTPYQSTVRALLMLLGDEGLSPQHLKSIQAELDKLSLEAPDFLRAGQAMIVQESSSAYGDGSRLWGTMTLPYPAFQRMFVESSFQRLENQKTKLSASRFENLLSVSKFLDWAGKTHLGDQKMESGIVQVFPKHRADRLLSLPLQVQLCRGAIAMRLNSESQGEPLKALDSLNLDSKDLPKFRFDEKRVLHLEVEAHHFQVAIP